MSISKESAEQIRKLLGLEENTNINNSNDPIKIVVLQRGWVVVGYYSNYNGNCVLRNASVIRNWGTTKGLGEIAKNGPTDKTKLDPTNGDVEFNELTVVLTIKCESSEWKNKLK